MKKRAELVNDFLDEANSHHFICDADWNLDEDQPLSIYIADKDENKPAKGQMSLLDGKEASNG